MKIITFLFTLSLTISVNSQIEIFNENFETGISSTWSIVNLDLLTPNLEVEEYSQSWISSLNPDDISDTVASSTSYFTSPGAANRWLISPQVTLGTFGNFLSWNSKSFDPSHPESFRVMISTTGNNPLDFNDTLDFFSFENSVWTNHELNLDSLGYTDQAVYLAFVLYTNDGFKFLLDDVKVRKDDPVSVKEVEKKSFSIAPNPATNCIEFTNISEIISISIFSSDNKELLKITNGLNTIDISSLNSGIYIVKLTSNKGLISERKFIKI